MEYLQYFDNKLATELSALYVLNLVISGIPSILTESMFFFTLWLLSVLNLVISGIPSILGIWTITEIFQGKKF